MKNENVANSTKKIRLYDCLEKGDEDIIEGFCINYFEDCEYNRDYTIEGVCPDGNIKLFCGYFKGEYGIIEIEIIGLYPTELENIKENLIPGLEERLLKVPKRWGRDRFNYEIATNRIEFRFYACKKSEKGEKSELIESIDELKPSLEFLERFLRNNIVVQGK